jgi:hypothetical protein
MEGDLLFVYDFEGGDAAATISVREWILSGTCEVGSSSPPCWGQSQTLGVGVAEARVNTTSVGPVDDDLAPAGDNSTTSESLGIIEFGEAGVNLTEAGIFDENVCLGFGKAYAVSRSSGNSAQAQMKDLVGPGEVNIANCGTVIIRKVTDPSPDSTDTEFDYTTTGGLSPSSFMLKNGENRNFGTGVFAGAYSVTEAAETGWDFTSLDCSASSISNGTTIDTSAAPTVSFNLKALDTVDCTYTNTARSSLSVTKAVVSACQADATDFTIFIDSTPDTYDDSSTGGDGTTVSNGALPPGTYGVGENDPGSGYASSIGGDADCSDGSVDLGAGESVSCTVTNVRKPTIRINKVVTNGDLSTFDLLIDDGNDGYDTEVEARGNGGTTGAVTISTTISSTTFGPVKLTETSANGPGLGTESIGTFTNYWSCNDTGATNGAGTSITVPVLLSGEDVVCTVTNIPVAAAACSPGS